MRDDVERVAVEMAGAEFWSWNDITPQAQAGYLKMAAAAMRETRLIDAEALRAMDGRGLVRHRTDVADWLTARAQEVGE